VRDDGFIQGDCLVANICSSSILSASQKLLPIKTEPYQAVVQIHDASSVSLLGQSTDAGSGISRRGIGRNDDCVLNGVYVNYAISRDTIF
jgi:hypothetical protein